MLRSILVFGLIALGTLSGGAPLRAQAPTPQEAVVRQFVEAFNRKDLDGLLALADTGISWISVIGDSTRVEVHGQPGLRVSLESYFQSFPSASSTLESVRGVNRWVSAWERSTRDTPEGPRIQLSLSVYEVQDGRVRRVYYYPAIRVVP